jgi:CHASE2 domain-containing sensor protein
MNYDDFDLLIESQPHGQYTIIAQSHMGEASGEISPGSDLQEAAAIGGELGAGELNSDRLISFGKILFQQLFKGEIRDLYHTAFGHVLKEEERGMRIRLAIIPPEISVLPWELIYDPAQDCFLATSIKTPLVRYVRLPAPIRELKVAPPLKVLVVIPQGSGLEVRKETAIIEKALAELEGAVDCKLLEGVVTTARIADELIADRYHILHFIGHGVFQNDEGYLLINTEAGKSLPISARAFARFFSDYPYVKLIILNSCQGATGSAVRPFAGLASQLVRQGIPAVIAMQRAILDTTAISFSRGFYTKLCKGWDRGRVDVAISHARNMIYIDQPETEEFATPALFMRSATGVIFDLDLPKEQSTWRLTTKDIHRLMAVKRTREINLNAWAQITGQETSEAAEIAIERQEIAIISRLLRHWKSGVALALTTGLVFFAFWIGLFNVLSLDQRVEKRLSRYFDAVGGKELVMILAEEDPQKNGSLGSPGTEWRQYHARLIDALSRVGASVIAFDLEFEKSSRWDQQLGEAIKQAREHGTAVVLGARSFEFNGDQPLPKMSADLRELIQEDNWGTGKIDGMARQLQVASLIQQDLPEVVEVLERPVVPSLALQVVRHAEAGFQRKPLTIIYDAEKGQIDLRDPNAKTVRIIPVDQNLALIFNLINNPESHPYHEVLDRLNDARYLMQLYKGKIVMVGYRQDADRHKVAEDEKRYGVEIQASAITALLNELYIQRLRPAQQYLIILLMGLIAFILRALPERWRRFKVALELPYLKDTSIPVLLILVTVLYLLTAIVVYDRHHVILAVNYHVVGLWLAYWAIGLAQKRHAAEV